MANKKSTAGDHTGKKRVALAKQHAEELRKREHEITLINEQAAEESDEITDLTVSGGVPGVPLEMTRQPGQSGVTTVTASDGVMTVTEGSKTYKIKTNATALTGDTGAESPSHVPGESPTVERVRGVVDTKGEAAVLDPSVGARGLSADGDDSDVQDVGVKKADDSVVIRVNTTLEDVTIGQGNNYSFREGGKYRVPAHVANHLEERGLVWH